MIWKKMKNERMCLTFVPQKSGIPTHWKRPNPCFPSIIEFRHSDVDRLVYMQLMHNRHHKTSCNSDL